MNKKDVRKYMKKNKNKNKKRIKNKKKEKYGNFIKIYIV